MTATRVSVAPETELACEQERLWFLERLHPGQSALNAPVLVRLRGTLDVQALRDALVVVVSRHAPLRTMFLPGARPSARVLPAVHVELPVLDFTGAMVEPDWRSVVTAEVNRPFDLAMAPLFRCSLIRLSDNDHILVMVAHHIVVDRWSLSLVFTELEALYRPGGSVGILPPLLATYADYVSAQRSHLASSAGAGQLAYWREQLAEAHPLELPTDRQRPSLPRHRAEHVTEMLPPRQAAELSAAARRLRATPFMVALAAITAVLSRWTGERDVCVGTPLTTRTRNEFAPLIGMFLNNVVLRVDVSGQPSFADLVARTRTTVIGAVRNGDFPFAELVRQLDPARDPSRTPLFQIAVNMTNVPPIRPALRGLECTPLDPPVPGANFDLTLYLDPMPDGLELAAVYDPDLYERPTMAELLAQTSSLLTHAITDTDRPIAHHSLVTARARALIPDPRAPLSSSWLGSVSDLADLRAVENPEQTAVVGMDGNHSHGALRATAAAVAQALSERGVKPGDAVAILAARSSDLVPAILGTIRSGGAFLLLDGAHPVARLRSQMDVVQARVLIVVGDQPAPAELVRAVPEPPLRIDWLGADDALAMPPVPVSSSDRAYLAFTSGTSDNPKIVVGKHGSLTHFLPWHVKTFGLTPDDRYSLLSGLSHDPLHRDILTPLITGARVVVPDPARLGTPGWLAQWFDREQVTVTHLTPAMASVIAAGAGNVAPIPHLRLAFFTGEPLRRSQLDAFRRLFPRARCVNSYGSTETSRAVALFEIRQDEEWRAAPLGRGIPDVQLLVLTDAGDLAGIGELGQLCFRSPFLASGYLHDDGATAGGSGFGTNPFTGAIDDRLFYSGDLGKYRADGEVRLVGRIDQQIQIRGYRVEPSEVQMALEDHPGVRTAAVIARTGLENEPLLAGFVEPAEGWALTAVVLRTHLRRLLPEYMVPASIAVLDRMPLTTNGKIDWSALPATSLVATGSTPPRTPIERIVADIWSDLLDVGSVAVEDNFFHLGGHSVIAIQFAARLHDVCGVDLPLFEVFTHPTVGEMATLVLERLAEVAIPKTGEDS